MQLTGVRPLDSQVTVDDPLKLAELRKMKFIATALLGIAFIIFIIASIYEGQAVWVGFVQATAEAAMVGAIADWFAVTALFRHPLGLKIPHTAIIPSRKDSIGQNLGRFVRNNFLSREVVSEKLRSMEVTRRVALWLNQPRNSALVADQVAEALAAAVQVIKDDDVQALIEHNVADWLRSTRFSPVFGNLLALLISGSRKQELLSGMIKYGAEMLEENKAAIQQKISQETPWWLPRNVDNKIYQKLVDAIDETLHEVSEDPDHPLHKRFGEVVDHFVEDLKNSPDVIAREDALKEELLQQAVVREFSSSLWTDVKASIIEHASDSESTIRMSIQRALVGLSGAVLEDETLLKKIDHWVEEVVVYVMERYGHEVEHLISQTISKWDGDAASRKIELQVGKDLQFIRINGTVVGGLVGFGIHALSLLL
jgi:uncharacterized membrane-anchored protein YjiN (DUF445 family)